MKLTKITKNYQKIPKIKETEKELTMAINPQMNKKNCKK